MKTIKLNNNKVVKVDDDDFKELSLFHWYAPDNNGYYRARADFWKDGKKKSISMSRFITNCSKGMVVDHINGDTLDNRRSNLRVCTHSENMRNRRILSKNNKTGYKGVSWNIFAKQWQVGISFKGKHMTVGYSRDIKEAAKIYNEAAIKYHGDFATLNKVN